MKIIIGLMFAILPAIAFAEQAVQQKCEAVIGNYLKLTIPIEQAGLALNVQKGVIEICQAAIAAEAAKAAEPKAEEKKKQ